MKTKNKQQILTEERLLLPSGGELPVLTFDIFKELPWLSHCFTTRDGGVSEGMYASLNLSFNRGDDPAHVMENYRRVAEALNFSPGSIVASDQTHTTNVRHVTAADAGKGVLFEKDYREVDGLITDTPGILLATFYADCVPLYFVDPKHRAIGLSHSGWRGTVASMGAVTIRKMKECFGSNPQDILCGIGPSICQDCYEVSEDVAHAFRQRFARHQQEILTEGKPGKYQLDLWQANRLVLLESGILPEHMAVTNICTCCNSQRLFSHRASKGRRGNLGAFCGIRA
jgi:YfiH family protein